MPLNETMLAEYNSEAPQTRKMLERVPFDHPEWKPHDKSMTIQRLSSHIAELPFWMMRILGSHEFDFLASRPERFIAKDKEELLKKFDEVRAEASAALQQASDEELLFKWVMRGGDKIYLTLPRMIVIRNFVFSHAIHHRGQLSVYLRLNNIAVPGMYGPSADER
jgi:uncharacterized damage-inducible protein DinB